MTDVSGTASLARTTEEDMEFQKEISTRGLDCPLPILHTKKALTDMQSGGTLKTLATGPGATRDFQVFARQTDNGPLEYSEHSKMFTFYVRRR